MRQVIVRYSGRMSTDHLQNLGNKFGKLTVLSMFLNKKYIYYRCRCDCGRVLNTASFHVIKGKSTSCGCKPKVYPKPRKDIKPNGGSAGNYVFLTYRRNAKKREYVFELTKEQFADLVIKNCNYCDSPPSQTARYVGKNKSGTFTYSGIDRVDNSKGYVLGNCVSCCNVCNKAKGSLSLPDFLKWIERLVVKWS